MIALNTFHPGQTTSTSSNVEGHNLTIAQQRFISAFGFVSRCSSHSIFVDHLNSHHALTFRFPPYIVYFSLFSKLPDDSRLVHVKWESRAIFLTIYDDLYKTYLWGICIKLNLFVALPSASESIYNVINMAAI